MMKDRPTRRMTGHQVEGELRDLRRGEKLDFDGGEVEKITNRRFWLRYPGVEVSIPRWEARSILLAYRRVEV